MVKSLRKITKDRLLDIPMIGASLDAHLSIETSPFKSLINSG
jgi:hypothetical protein